MFALSMPTNSYPLEVLQQLLLVRRRKLPLDEVAGTLRAYCSNESAEEGFAQALGELSIQWERPAREVD